MNKGSEEEEQNELKEATPLQAIIANIDNCLDDNKTITSSHQLGFIQGLLEARRACEKLLDYEQGDLEKAFEAGLEDSPSKSGKQYYAEVYGSAEVPKEPEFEYADNTVNGNFFKSFVGESATAWILSLNKFSRRVFYIILTLFMFTVMVFWTVVFIITLRFSRLSDIPKDIRKKTMDLEEFLNL